MSIQLGSISGSTLKPNLISDNPCLEPGHTHTHVHHHRHDKRWRPLTLIIVTVLGTVIALGSAFLSGFYYRGSFVQVAEPSPIVEENAAMMPAETLNLVDKEEILTRLYEQAGPAVVKILVAQQGKVDLSSSGRRGDGVGSGVIFDRQGYIVTNRHVVDKAVDVVVELADGRAIQARVLGRDSGTDLAVLQIDVPSQGLSVASFSNSNALHVGQFAIAIGHPFGLDKSLTVGHISGLERVTPTGDKYTPVIEGMIQTDAAINPGNSSGPLFNLKGEVVGINTSIFSTSRGSQGVGFAVRSNTVRHVVDELLQKGYVSRPFLGVSGLILNAQRARLLGLEEVEHGLLIQEVSQDSPAWLIGLRPGDKRIRVGQFTIRTGGDVLIAIDGQPLTSLEMLSKLLGERAVSDTIILSVYRNGEEIELEATLSDRPAPASAGVTRPTIEN